MKPQAPTAQALLETLVAFDTTSRLSNLALIDFVEDYLNQWDVRCERIFNAEGTKANLFVTIGPNVSGGVILSGHTDVVPVDGQDWTTDPFTLTSRGDQLFGRGTCDMKGFLACVLAQVPRMAAAPLKRPLHLAFSYDEEVGCTGAPSMIEHIICTKTKPALCIVGEPTSMRIIHGHKSINAYRTTITGLEAHSSRTQEGVNAIEVAAKLITFLYGLAEEMKTRTERDDAFEPPYTSLSVGTIRGGTAVNIIPREAQFAWEYRALPTADQNEIAQRFATYCDEIRTQIKRVSSEADIQTTEIAAAPGLFSQPGQPTENLVLAWAERNATEAVAYATEGGLFQNAGIPTYICGPGDIAHAHRPNEFVKAQELAQCEAFLGRIITHCSKAV